MTTPEESDISDIQDVPDTPVADEDGVEFDSSLIDADASASTGYAPTHIHLQDPRPTGQLRLASVVDVSRGKSSKLRVVLIILEWLAIAGFFSLFLYLLYTLIVPPSLALTKRWQVEATPGRWQYVVVHHSATAGGNPDSFDRFHREKNGWENGLGYHFVIGNGIGGMKDGEVAVGHRWRDQLDGAHVRMPGSGKANSFSIGIALVGDFDKTEPTRSQLVSLIRLLRFLTSEYGIAEDKIVGHGAVAIKHTECPGKLFPMDGVLRSLIIHRELGR